MNLLLVISTIMGCQEISIRDAGTQEFIFTGTVHDAFLHYEEDFLRNHKVNLIYTVSYDNSICLEIAEI